MHIYGTSIHDFSSFKVHKNLMKNKQDFFTNQDFALKWRLEAPTEGLLSFAILQ